MKASDYIINELYTSGVKHMFVFPGGGCIHLLDSIKKHPKIEYTVCHHEQACAIAAEAYSQYKRGNIAGVLVTTGPGGTNALTGLVSAWDESIPVVFVSGQIQSKDFYGPDKLRQKGFQGNKILEMVENKTKDYTYIYSSWKLKTIIQTSVNKALAERPGPIWFDVALDFQSKELTPRELDREEAFYNQYEPDTIKYQKVDGIRIIKEIQNHKKPVFLIGNGVYISRAEETIRYLTHRLNIPTLLTWKIIDEFNDNDEMYFGRPGIIAQRWANIIQQQADLLIVIGARLDPGQIAFNFETFAPKAKIIQVDIDKFELDKFSFQNRVEQYHANAYHFVEQLMLALDRIDYDEKIFDKWVEKCRSIKTRFEKELCDTIKKRAKNSKDYDVYEIIDILSDVLPRDAVIIPGSSGTCSEVFMQIFKNKTGQRIYNSLNLGAMGFGVPATIGAAIASKKPVYCVEGDGSFMLNIQELETIKRLGLSILIFILNNNGYVSIRNTQEKHLDGNFVGSDINQSDFSLPDLKRVVEAFNIEFVRLEKNKYGIIESLHRVIDTFLSSPRPLIVELMCDKNHKTIFRTRVINTKDGFETAPMEDLEPPINKKELKKLME